MKSLIGLWKVLAEDLSAIDGVSTHRDSITVTERVEHEGIGFLILTLPAFASDFERCLELGKVGSGHFCGFRKRGSLPLFLGGFFRRVFDSQSGKILDDACPNSVLAIRQLTLLFKKLELEPSPSRVKKAFSKYVECEDELKQLEREWTGIDTAEFSRVSSLLFGDIFDAVNREIDNFEIRPRHGPGSTADRLVGNQKWRFAEWTERLEGVFPYRDYAGPNLRLSTVPSVHLSPREEWPVRVIQVPKDARGPRIIAMEPTPVQYMQQGISNSLTRKLEPSSAQRCAVNASPVRILSNPFLASSSDRSSSKVSFLGFRDQETNRLLAQKGSYDGTLATLDLSEASDRVLNTLVLDLFRPWPSLSEAVQATRSRSAILGDGTKVRLTKFASMGSALCFPIEAIVFCTIAMLGIQDARKTRLTPRDLVRLRGKVRVYGDDIIVPADSAVAVAAKLEAFGLKVNEAKSFWNGSFRESCGGDYFKGEWVTPLRLRKIRPTSRRDVQGIQNWIEFSNSLHMSGFWKAAEYVADELRSILGPIPVTDVETKALSLKSFLPGTRGKVGWDRQLHRPKLHAWVAESVIPINEIDGDAALRKCLLGDWSDPIDRQHLLRSGRPSSVHLKKRWVPA